MRRKAIAGWIRVVVVMVVLLGGAAPELSAQQYEYDSLNRLISVEQEKKSVHYTYDAGGISSQSRPLLGMQVLLP